PADPLPVLVLADERSETGIEADREDAGLVSFHRGAGFDRESAPAEEGVDQTRSESTAERRDAWWHVETLPDTARRLSQKIPWRAGAARRSGQGWSRGTRSERIFRSGLDSRTLIS